MKNKKLIKDFDISSFKMSGGMIGGGGVDPPTTTKGDISGFDTTYARVPVGADGTVLTADSTTALGIGYAAAGGAEFNNFTSVSTWNPTKQTGNAEITIDNTDLTTGTINIVVDGSLVDSYSSGINTRIVNPSSSLAISSTNYNYDISSAVYDSISETVADYFLGMYFRADGDKWYSIGYDGLREYDMSTTYDVGSSSIVNTFATRPTTEYATTVWFKPDGTKAWMSENASNKPIRQIEFSTAWDVSTASYTGASANYTPAGSLTVKSLYFKDDGNTFYSLFSNEDVRQFSMSTSWDVSTASLVNTYSTTSQDSNPRGIDFNSNGTKYYIVGDTNNTVFEYSMSTAWDISTSAYTGISFSVASQTTAPSSVRFGDSGAKMYVMRENSRVYQYSTTSAYSGTSRGSLI